MRREDMTLDIHVNVTKLMNLLKTTGLVVLCCASAFAVFDSIYHWLMFV